jgi:hypothetical protein
MIFITSNVTNWTELLFLSQKRTIHAFLAVLTFIFDYNCNRMSLYLCRVVQTEFTVHCENLRTSNLFHETTHIIIVPFNSIPSLY